MAWLFLGRDEHIYALGRLAQETTVVVERQALMALLELAIERGGRLGDEVDDELAYWLASLRGMDK